jgi:hypothetical protein
MWRFSVVDTLVAGQILSGFQQISLPVLFPSAQVLAIRTLEGK